MIKIQIPTNLFITRNWNDKTTGALRSMRIQTALAYLVNADGETDNTYDKIEVILNDKQLPFSKGEYQLSPQCIYLDRNGRLQISLQFMQPVNHNSVKAVA